MNKKYNKKLGSWGEDLAARFLAQKGYVILKKNARNCYGEIDLICQRDNEIIFVEVKTRTSKKFGDAEEAVSFYKKQKIFNAIEKYLQENDIELAPIFEVVIVEIFSLTPNIIHYQNVELN